MPSALRSRVPAKITSSIFVAAQGTGRLFAEDPADGVEDIRLAAAIGADDGGHALAGQGELGAVAEGLEAEDLDLLQFEHR